MDHSTCRPLTVLQRAIPQYIPTLSSCKESERHAQTPQTTNTQYSSRAALPCGTTTAAKSSQSSPASSALGSEGVIPAVILAVVVDHVVSLNPLHRCALLRAEAVAGRGGRHRPAPGRREGRAPSYLEAGEP